MAFDLGERLRQSNARFLVSIHHILERYNHPFEDDYVVSMETLTYDTPAGPKQWGEVSKKELKNWKAEILEHNRASPRNAEMSKQQTSDLEDRPSTAPKESPEASHMDTSDIDAESDADIASVRSQFEDIHFKNQYVDDVEIQENAKIQVDVIVQDHARNIPKWITIAPQGSSEGPQVASPVQELIGNQATVCRRVELSNECSSSRSLQLQSSVPISPCTITITRHETSPELNKSCYDSIFQEYQSADEECSWSNVTLADLYPAMVKTFIRLMKKQSQRKVFKYLFGNLRHRRMSCRRPRLNVTVDKIRGFRPLKLKRALPSICSSRSKDIQNQAFGNDLTEFSADNSSINNLSTLVPYSHVDTNEVKMDYSDSSLEHHLVSGSGQRVSKQTVFPNVMARMGETFLVEDELQSTVSLKSSKCKESEKSACKCSSEYPFKTSTASSESTALHLVKETKAQKIDFPGGDTSKLCSSTWSFSSNSSTFARVTSCSFAKASKTLFPITGKTISERLISFQGKHSFSPLSVKHSPSKTLPKSEDAFEKLYYGLCSKEFQKPLAVTRPIPSSQNFEVKGRLVKGNLSDSVKSDMQYAREFDRICEQLCSDAVPKLPGFQRASNLRKYEGIQMSETVNALVNSPVRTSSAFPRVKRLGNFQNDLLCSPVKRLRNIPERYFPLTECQQISHRKNVPLQTDGMHFLSTCNGSNPSFFASHNCQHQDYGFHASSDKTFLGIPGTSLQGIADAHSSWPQAVKNYNCPRNAQKCHQRIFRKLSYTDDKDKNSGSPLDDFPVKNS
ncbi:Holliday junction recognition protein isoform X2 [Apus apus]|uniref:Holliday junction recognition protein isoform X2 n=1 Tax=Apus apus TaxID=8895 RepID=UPI0021F86D51|nr:Holliday junction recognition protein isoform X2 [Apus apus]